jgi:hypothetical protein
LKPTNRQIIRSLDSRVGSLHSFIRYRMATYYASIYKVSSTPTTKKKRNRISTKT